MSDEATAIEGTRKAIKEMADGTLRIQIDIEPRHKKQFHKLFPEIDMLVAIAPLKPVAEGMISEGKFPGDITHTSGKAVDQVMENFSKYGQQARELKLSDFFRRPEVWRAVGTDDEFLAWIRQQPCVEHMTKCLRDDNPVVPAHVRRVANGAGTGIKPPYSAIPLCQHLHQQQTDRGESAVHGREWWDKQRIHYVQKWCWETLKAKLGYESWSEVPPEVLLEWAYERGISGSDGQMWLPKSYYPDELE